MRHHRREQHLRRQGRHRLCHQEIRHIAASNTCVARDDTDSATKKSATPRTVGSSSAQLQESVATTTSRVPVVGEPRTRALGDETRNSAAHRRRQLADRRGVMGRRRRQRAASDQRRECAPEAPQPAVTSPSTEVATVAPPTDSGWITTAVERMMSFFGGGHARRSSEVAPTPAHGKGTTTGRTGLAHGKAGGKGATTNRTGNQAWIHLPQKKHTPPAPPQAPPQPQAQRQHRVVNGEEVPFEVEDQYIHYCRESRTIVHKTICHICFFQEQNFTGSNRVSGSQVSSPCFGLLLCCIVSNACFVLLCCVFLNNN